MKVADLIGNEETVNELMKILTEGTEMSMAHGKIVSIVGLGGLGKTTLAHAIYRKLRAQFDCWAFVSMSRNPDMKKLFKCMLYQLGKKNNANIHEGILDERQLIYELNEFLQKRRYECMEN
jgi:Holliday junction resolvasome RuvABC ATP-dependent DNA helicase subunit